MSQENVEVVRGILRLWSEDRSARHLIDPELEYVNLPYAVESGTSRGRGKLGKIRDVYPDFRVEPERFVDAGEDVVVIGIARGTSASGLELNGDKATFGRFTTVRPCAFAGSMIPGKPSKPGSRRERSNSGSSTALRRPLSPGVALHWAPFLRSHARRSTGNPEDRGCFAPVSSTLCKQEVTLANHGPSRLAKAAEAVPFSLRGSRTPSRCPSAASGTRREWSAQPSATGCPRPPSCRPGTSARRGT